jgi:hypothetical protein
MTFHDPEAQSEKIAGIVQRYRDGEFGTVVFTASLAACGMQLGQISDLVYLHLLAHQESLPYLRGDVR